MPRRADCEQEDQKIREDIKRTRDDEERFPVDAVTSVGWIPEFPNGVALKDDREEGGNIKGQVGPDQDMASSIHRSGFRGCEDMYHLEK